MPSTLLTAFMMGGVSLIPLFFGMRKKSTSATITCPLKNQINKV
jgi:hypothetical protein